MRKKNNQTYSPTIPLQDNTQDPPDREILDKHKQLQGMRNMCDMQQDGVDKPT